MFESGVTQTFTMNKNFCFTLLLHYTCENHQCHFPLFVKFCFYAIPGMNVQHLNIYRIILKESKPRDVSWYRIILLNASAFPKFFWKLYLGERLTETSRQFCLDAFCKWWPRRGEEIPAGFLPGDETSFSGLNRKEQHKYTLGHWVMNSLHFWTTLFTTGLWKTKSKLIYGIGIYVINRWAH